MDKEFLYIYDFLLVKKLIKSGYPVLKVGLGDKYDDLFFKFISNEETNQIYTDFKRK